jgi:LDH2 family malate/lactate/ureidoglycolate dehydrogenase
MSQDEVRIDAATLKRFMVELFLRIGLPPEDAETGADALVWCNLRGVDSHGVLRFPWFVRLKKRGDLNPTPDIRIVREKAAILVIDGDRGLGAVTASFAMRRATEKARQAGLGWALVTNTVTPLAIGYYTLIAAKADMIGIAATCDRPNMAPFGAKAPGLHNGPLSVAVPAKNYDPILLDMATSVAARGKIDYALDKGTSIPQGWALDKEGKPTTNAHLASIMLPFGGYKGSDISMIIECLTGIMAGDPRVGPQLLNKDYNPRSRQNSVMAAIEIGAFTDVEAFKEHVDDLIEAVKGLPTAEGFHEILVPGEPEDRVYAERSVHGIPLPPGTVDRLKQEAGQLRVELPSAMQ